MKVTSLVQSIPSPVMAGISFLNFGILCCTGLRMLVEAKVDFSQSRNLVVTAAAISLGSSGVTFKVGPVDLKGMALTTFFCIAVNLAHWLASLRQVNPPLCETTEVQLELGEDKKSETIH